GSQFGQRNGGFGGPILLVAGGGDKPLWIPRRVTKAALGRPAAMVDRELPVAGVVAIDVEHERDAGARVEIGVRSPCFVFCRVIDAWRFGAADAEIQVLIVKNENRGGGISSVVVGGALERDGLGDLPNRIVKAAVEPGLLRGCHNGADFLRRI